MEGDSFVSAQILDDQEASLRKRELFAVSLRKERKKALLFERRKKIKNSFYQEPNACVDEIRNVLNRVSMLEDEISIDLARSLKQSVLFIRANVDINDSLMRQISKLIADMWSVCGVKIV